VFKALALNAMTLTLCSIALLTSLELGHFKPKFRSFHHCPKVHQCCQLGENPANISQDISGRTHRDSDQMDKNTVPPKTDRLEKFEKENIPVISGQSGESQQSRGRIVENIGL